MITDRLRFSVMEMNTNIILSKNLNVKEPQVMAALSGPAQVNFKIAYGESQLSSKGIKWEAWGQWIITELEVDGVRKVVACTMVNEDCKVDPDSGDLSITSIGFSEYAKGIPWLENWNDIAVDPFDIVQRIWSHLQSFNNANFGIDVLPASSGTLMLPGYGFDGAILSFDFFALFTRAIDFPDCGDYYQSLSRDIPFDYLEECEWNDDRTEVSKTLRLGYPNLGVRQDYLTFRLGENVSQAQLADEKDVEWVSDVIVRGWFPGKVYSSQLRTDSPTRARRTVLEEDVNIDSTERAIAWAGRKLQRRTVPIYWQKIIINPNHNAGAFGKWKLGDSIFVQGMYPWHGEVADWHRIMAWAYDEKSGTMELTLKVEGAFNYDPIGYDPDGPAELEDKNLLSNGYFTDNLSGWNPTAGSWFRLASDGYSTPGVVRVQSGGGQKRLISHKIPVTAGETLSELYVGVKYVGVSSTAGPGFIMRIMTYTDGGFVASYDLDTVDNPVGGHTWQPLQSFNWVVPAGINDIAMQLTVASTVTDGYSLWDDAKVLR